MNFAAANWSQWLAGCLSSFAAFWTIRGALIGSGAHRAPRMTLGIIIVFMSVFYPLSALDVITDPAVAAGVLRGVGFVMWPTIAWVSISGIRHSRRMAHLASILEGTETDEGAWKQHG